MPYPAEQATPESSDRVRRATARKINDWIDRQTDADIQCYAEADSDAIRRRIDQLDREWDIERALEVNASVLALSGLALGAGKSRKWLFLPAVVLGFLFQHGMEGWCPPLPVLRRLGFRTRGEIDREKYSLLAVLARKSGTPPPGLAQLG